MLACGDDVLFGVDRQRRDLPSLVPREKLLRVVGELVHDHHTPDRIRHLPLWRLPQYLPRAPRVTPRTRTPARARTAQPSREKGIGDSREETMFWHSHELLQQGLADQRQAPQGGRVRGGRGADTPPGSRACRSPGSRTRAGGAASRAAATHVHRDAARAPASPAGRRAPSGAPATRSSREPAGVHHTGYEAPRLEGGRGAGREPPPQRCRPVSSLAGAAGVRAPCGACA